MITIYTTDNIGVFAGAVQTDPMGAIPRRSTFTPPPETTGTEVVQLIGRRWVVLPEYPTPPTPSPPVVPIPQSVTMRQACVALEMAGLLDDVEAIVATLPRLHQIEWERASQVFRDNPLVEIVRQQQSMSDAQIDALFVAAAAL